VARRAVAPSHQRVPDQGTAQTPTGSRGSGNAHEKLYAPGTIAGHRCGRLIGEKKRPGREETSRGADGRFLNHEYERGAGYQAARVPREVTNGTNATDREVKVDGTLQLYAALSRICKRRRPHLADFSLLEV
jgi:hypothetical protein